MVKDREIRLMIADDHTIVRQGLKKLLEEETGVEVVGEAVDGRDAVTKAMDLMPDIIIMDLSMPGLHGLEATRQITKRLPKSKVIILSMHKNDAYVQQALRAGASGYILKDSASEEVLGAIRSVSRGDSFLSPAISRVLIDDYLRLCSPGGGGPRSLYEKLTVREREIFQLLAEGNRNQQIADQLHVSIKTVETHRAHIMDKLNLNNIAELVKCAIEVGIVQIDT